MNTKGKTLLGAIIVIFIIAYAAIALEHRIKINKSASALLGAGLLWSVYATLSGDHVLVEQQLHGHVLNTRPTASSGNSSPIALELAAQS